MPSNAFEKSVRRTSFMDCYQCITVRQRPTRSPFAHYSALFLCTLSIFHDVTLPCYTFFMLHPFSIALNFCCTFLCYTFLFCTLPCYHLFTLHFFHVKLFSYCPFSWSIHSMLHFLVLSYAEFFSCYKAKSSQFILELNFQQNKKLVPFS